MSAPSQQASPQQSQCLSQVTKPSAPMIRIAAAIAAGLIPPSSASSPWFRIIFRELSTHVTRYQLLAIAWPFLREHIKKKVKPRLVSVPAISISLDEWIVAGRANRLWAVNVHAVDASWTRFVANLGLVSQLPRSSGIVIDPRPVLEAFGVRDRVFAVVAGHSDDIGLIIDNRLNNVIGECFRGGCLFSAVSDAVYRVCARPDADSLALRQQNVPNDTSDSSWLVVHGETDVTVEDNASRVAHCISIIQETIEFRASPKLESNPNPTTPASINGGSVPGGSCHVTDDIGQGNGVDESGGDSNEARHAQQQGGTSVQDGAGDVHMDGNVLSVAAAAEAAATGILKGHRVKEEEEESPTAARVTTITVDNQGINSARLPKPWLKGNFLSMLTEWEMLCGVVDNETEFSGEYERLVRDNVGDENWVLVRAVVKVLQLIRRMIGGRERWHLLPDALIKMINLVCAICDRLTEIESIMEQSIIGGAQYGSTMHQRMLAFVRTRTVRREDVEESSMMVAMVEGCLMNRLLRELYPLVQPFVEYMPKQSYCLVALALDPRFGSLASLISLNKKLMQGCRLVFEKEIHTEFEPCSEERVRKMVRNMLSRYDNEIVIPMMVSLNDRVGNESSGATQHQRQDGEDMREVNDGEEGLFPETLEATDDWKNRQQLQGELNKFRSFKKNIAKTASGAESLRWWESNADLFPNIATLFRKVVSVPSSHVPADRILYADGAKMKVARRRLSRAGLEDVVLIHENLTGHILNDAVGVVDADKEDGKVDGHEWQLDLNDAEVAMDDDDLYQLAPELFSS